MLRVGEQFSRAVTNGGKFELLRLHIRQTANLRFKLRICQDRK